jgi:hypothetical protein
MMFVVAAVVVLMHRAYAIEIEDQSTSFEMNVDVRSTACQTTYRIRLSIDKRDQLEYDLSLFCLE